MLLAGGEAPAKFYRNTSTRGGPLHFEAEQSGLELDKVTGAYPLDIDSDGITDLVLLRVGESVVMRGLGACKFERANETWGFNGGDAWWTAFSATWEHGADWPTLAIGSYIDRNQEIEPWGSCTDNWLHRPKVVDGKTAAVRRAFAAQAQLLRAVDAVHRLEPLGHAEPAHLQRPRILSRRPGAALAHRSRQAAGPLHRQGRMEAPEDLGHGHRQLRRHRRRLSRLFPDQHGRQQAADPDQAPSGRSAKPDYKDVAFPKNAIAQRPYTGGDVRPSTAWHAQFEDVNNDGLVDLFIAKGNVSEMPDFASKDPNNLLLQGADGKFQEVGDKAGVASMAGSRGAALADFNLDGLLDLVVVNRGHRTPSSGATPRRVPVTGSR